MAYSLFKHYVDSAVEDFRSLKGKGGHFEKGLFIAEGQKIAKKVLESSLEVPSAYMTEDQFGVLLSGLVERAGTTDIFLAPKSEMEQIVGYPLHQGVMLAVRIPKSRTLAEAAAEWKQPWLAVALDAITDAENMGGIIRNAAAFGATAIILDAQSCNPYLRRSVRVSMGTIIDIEIIPVPDLAVSLRELKSIVPCSVVGAMLREESRDLADVKPAGNTALVFGSEGWGLREAVVKECDILARIPMASGVDSLNVGVASGIFMQWVRKSIDELV